MPSPRQHTLERESEYVRSWQMQEGGIISDRHGDGLHARLQASKGYVMVCKGIRTCLVHLHSTITPKTAVVQASCCSKQPLGQAA